MGGTVGDVINVASLGTYKASGLQESFEPPDTKDVDAMYMSQARESEKNIKKIMAATAAERGKGGFGVKVGGGQTTQSVPSLTNLTNVKPSGNSLFE